MLKLYRFSGLKKEYWETWEERKGLHTVHWGELGTRGHSKAVKSTPQSPAKKTVQTEIDALLSKGFAPIDLEAHATLVVEYKVSNMGNKADVEKRHRLEARMNETLGWTGLGECDGGSIGSGTMEVFSFVVDFDLARKVVSEDLAATEFSDYIRIYDYEAD